jgi:rare lipoprotein A
VQVRVRPIIGIASVCLLSCVAASVASARDLSARQGKAKVSGQTGIASHYSYSRARTASGERLNPGAMTAAHRSLRFGTLVRVTHRRNGRSVVVRINDRGPFIRGRVIDVTPAAARALGFSGLAPVTIAVVGGSG